MTLSKICFVVLLLFNSYGIVRSQPNDMGSGIQLFEANKLLEARETFLKFSKEHPQNARCYVYLGRISFAEQEYKQAEKWFKKAVELEAANSDYNLWLAQTYAARIRKASFFSKMSLAKKSRKYFEVAVQLDENNVAAREGLGNYYLNAPGIAGGDLNKALQQAQELVKMDEPKGHILLARIYEKKKQMTLAEQEYKRLEELYGDVPAYANFYNHYGYFLLKQKRYDEAIARFQKQVNLTPNQANPHDSLGDGFRAAGRLQEAAAEYRKALQIDAAFEPSKDKLEKIVKQLERR